MKHFTDKKNILNKLEIERNILNTKNICVLYYAKW